MWLSYFHLYNPRVQYYKLLFIVLLHTQKKLVKYQNALLALVPNRQTQMTGAPILMERHRDYFWFTFFTEVKLDSITQAK